MTLSELKYIIALARHRHFGRAAEAAFVAQPTLSVAVKKLEEELGVALFERGTTAVTPTPVGERVVEQAQRVLEGVEEIGALASAARDPLGEPLRLGAIFTVGPYLLPHLVPRLHEAAPGMPLVVEEGYTADLTERLKRGELDVILISLPFEVPGLVTRPLYDEPFTVVLPASHPWSGRESVGREELGTETVLLLNDGHCFRDQVLAHCPECRPESGQPAGMARTVESSSLETIRYMVASGLGVSVMPCTAVGGELFNQRLLAQRRFAAEAPSRRIALAWRESFPRPEAVEAVAAAVRQCPLTCASFPDS
ncbi:LysR family transcriptional regulator [Thiohalorhabdus denitrificans]|uniref:Transcriptional regulator, LysR family n=1 Tax=Thiohalorhabdus denitrificans TaxID=381306 RepID=A0A0P9CWW1_9GAMM|nr:hydrogen peroxide-inducible genes activator [Thiohalorhabdus denitrificans]KPV41300.1 LysR family transcriptional regulator [Thiohalorhabdus denitrificans]SCY22251.1 transcriptional regulator, LysR family [Thiohalorhabdus denitrificans]